MRKRWISVALTVSVVAVVLGGLAVASGSASAPSKARWGLRSSSTRAPANRPATSGAATPNATTTNATTTITVTERYGNDAATVTPPTTSPTGVGGYDVFRDPLYNGSDTQVGHVLATCMPAFDGDSLCHGVLEFASGNITIDGSGIFTDGSLVLSITGGSGGYVGASGQVTINTAVSETAARITISLTSG